MSENTTPEVVEEVKTPEATQPEQETGKTLRDRFEAEQAKMKVEYEKVKSELDTIKQQEADKNKTLEEKLLEANQKIEQTAKELEKANQLSKIEKELLKENINPEFLNLINKEALDLTDGDNVADVITSIKSKYPTAFKPQSARNVGVGVTNSQHSQSIADLENKDLGDVSLSDFAKYRHSIK